MANLARSNKELTQMLFPPLKVIVDYIMQKLWNENREIIRKVVYDAYRPEMYQRTNQFKEAWDYKVLGSSGTGKIQGEFYYEPNKLTSGAGGQHSSFLTGEEMKEYLADVIYQGLAGDFTGQYKYAKQNPHFSNQAWANSRNAWDMLVKKVGKTNMDKWVSEGAKYAGLIVRSK